MKVLVVGSGGREHVTVWKLLQSKRDPFITCTPSNAGISWERRRCGSTIGHMGIPATDIEGLVSAAKGTGYDLTIVSSDDPLALGIVDRFQEEGLRIWGPTRAAAKFEWSKVYTHDFMERHGIPAPYGKAFNNNYDEALLFAESLGWKCAVKVDGLALGKGVFVCRTKEEVQEALTRIFVNQEFGVAGKWVLIQELVTGQEVSLHFFCDGIHAVAFPSSKDHKAEFDGNKGRNTGGMGTISPSPDITEEMHKTIASQIIEPWLKGCRDEGIEFKGILYPGIMLTEKGPVVLEFNARFGDPETQVYLPRLENDLLDIIDASIDGKLNTLDIRWKKEVAVCVVMAEPGYPGKYEKGKLITGLDHVATWPNVKVFHAGTKRVGDKVYTNGGRVLGVTAWASTVGAARLLAYRAVNAITFEGGAHYRKDIGGPPLDV
ncbi:MAG TPA: phosphoribosylamine--glycine ligase [Candidatus Paceibacterota bacterium]